MGELGYILELTVVKALLIKKPTLGSLRSCASVSVDGEQVQRTKVVKGQQAQWDKTFTLHARASSTVKIGILRQVKLPVSHDELLGEAVLSGFEEGVTEKSCDIYKHGRTDNSQGTLTLRLSVAKSSVPEQTVSPALQPAAAVMSAAESALNTVTNASGSESRGDIFPVVLERVRQIMEIGESIAELSPYAKIAWSVLSTIPQVLIAQLDRDAQICTLWSAAAEMLDFLKDANSIVEDQIVATVVKQMVQQIYECALFVREYGGKGYLRRTLRDTSSSSSHVKIAAFTTSFRELRVQFQSRSIVGTWKLVREIHEGVGSVVDTINSIENTRQLENLPGAKISEVRYDQGNRCLPDTRQEVIDEIVEWVNKPESTPYFWLYGVAGSGKSTISNTIAYMFDKLHRLGGSFRFSRDIASRNEPTYIFGNLAFQLTQLSPQLKSSVLAAIDQNGPMGSFPLRNQFATYIVDVLKSVELTGPIVFVIDALDESGTEQVRSVLLDALESEVVRLPKSVRFLIISRDEADIRAQLKRISTSKAMHQLEETSRDILVFINNRMPQIRRRSERLVDTDWPDLAARQKLVEKSHNLFIWAVVACRYIEGLDPEARLKAVLASNQRALVSAESSLNHLYLRILQDVCVDHDIPFQEVIGCIVAAMTPLSVQGLDDLLAYGHQSADGLERDLSQLGSAESVIGLLGSILQRETGTKGPASAIVRVLHPSLLDFFTNPQRCTDPRFFLQPSTQHRLMFLRCVAVMESLLKRDICEINDPTKLNSEVPNLQRRIEKCLPEHLQYSCRFWASHLVQVADVDAGLEDVVHRFLFKHLLHWIEAMTLMNEFDAAFIVLEKTHRRLERKDIVAISADALRFMQQFETPIRESAAHIYASALIFAPTETNLSKAFLSTLSRVPRVSTGLPREWSSCLAIYPSVWSIDVAKDKRRFVTRSSDTFHVRSMATGAILSSFTIDKAEPSYLYGGESFRFSADSDGSYLIIYTHSGIQVWDTFTGTKWLGPIPAVFHEISPNASYLVTVVDTMLVWDLRQRVVIAEPDLGPFPSLENEPIGLNPEPPFIFSPDGQQILRWVPHSTESKLSIAWFEIPTGEVTWTNRPWLSEGPALTAPAPLFCWLDNQTVVMNIGPRIEIFVPKSGETLHQYELTFDSFLYCISLLSGGTLLLSAGGMTPTITLLQPRNGVVLAGPYTLASYDSYPAYGAGHLCLCTQADSGEAVELHRIRQDGGENKVFVIPGKTRSPAALALSPDDSRIFALFRDGDLVVWDVENENHSFLQLPTHFHQNSFNFGLNISPDGSRLLISNNYDIQLFDLAMQYRMSKDIHSLSSSSMDSRHVVLVAASDRSAEIVVAYSDFSLELQSTMNRRRLSGHTDEINSVAFSVDASRVASASNDSTICLWDVQSASIEGNPIRGHSGPVMGAAFSNCGTKIASVSLDKTARIWSVVTHQQLWISKQRIDGLTGISFSHYDTNLVCTTSFSVHAPSQIVLDLSTMRSRRLLPIKWLSRNPNSDNVVAFSENADWWSWDASGSPTGYRLSIPSDSTWLRLRDVTFLPDNLRALGIYEESAVKITDTRSGEVSLFPIPDSSVQTLKWLPGGQIVVHFTDCLFVWDAISRELAVERYLLPSEQNCLSPDGSKMVFVRQVTSGIIVQLIDLLTSNVIWTHHPEFNAVVAYISSCNFSGDGDIQFSVAFHSMTGSVAAPMVPPPQLISLHADSGHVISNSVLQFEEHENFIQGKRPEAATPAHAIRAESTDKAASVIATRTLALLDVATGTVIHTLFKTETDDARWATAYSPDGILIACGTGDTVFVWNSHTGKMTNSWRYSSEQKQTNPEYSRKFSSGLIFSPDSTQVIYFNWDQEPGLHLWDIPENTLTGVLSGDYFGSPTFFQDGSGASLPTLYQVNENPTKQWAVSRDPRSRGLTAIDPSLQHSLPPIDLPSPPYHFSPPGSFMERARAFVGVSWVVDSPSSDSTRLAALNINSLIEIYKQHSTGTDSVPEVTTTFTCPHDVLGINPTGIIHPSGWLYGYTGQRLLWVPQTERKIWALLKRGLLVLENNAKEVVLVDLEDYLSYPALRRAWGDRNFIADAAFGKAQQLAVAANRVDIMEEFTSKEDRFSTER